MTKSRNAAIDAIKGVAIIAVVLYHFGGRVLPYGYLGVDVFFVVGGYLLIESLRKQFDHSSFNYWIFLFRKIVRLWPLIIIACTVALAAGYCLMLPDDYENLAESVVASSVFSNNILQCITTKNYWDVVNLYKPLMHLWYVGVLMQSYIILPIIYIITIKVVKNVRDGMKIATVCLTLVSLAIFLIPNLPSAWKIYLLPFRLFEITAGGLIVFFAPKASERLNKRIGLIGLSILLITLCIRTPIISASFMLLLTVVGSLSFIWSVTRQSKPARNITAYRIFEEIGKRSYSIYIWHQVVIAFLFYSFFGRQSMTSLIVLIVCTGLISIPSYILIESQLARIIGFKQKETIVILSTLFIAISISALSIVIYLHAGVVRDVPELDIYKGSVHHGMHAEYCDRPYSWDKDFEDTNHIKALVIGNSFGRDWANVLYEWDKGQKLDISYAYYTGGFSDRDLHEYQNRIDNSDILFFVTGGGVEVVPETLPKEKMFVVGSKSFGESNGIIYSHRFSDNYFNQTVKISSELLIYNSDMKSKYKEQYIDLLDPVLVNKDSVRVFTVRVGRFYPL